MRRIEELFDDVVATVGRDHAITFALLLHPAIASEMDVVRTDWRTRSDGSIAVVPSDDDITGLFDATLGALGHTRAVDLVERLDWRAARALDRRRGRWREKPTLSPRHGPALP